MKKFKGGQYMFNVLMGVIVLVVMIGSACIIGLLQEIRNRICYGSTSKMSKEIKKLCNIAIMIAVVIFIFSILLAFEYLSITLFTISIN